MRSACAAESFYKEHEGKRYCVLHFPGREKSADFGKALMVKLDRQDYDLRGVWFPEEPPFPKFEFSADADFRGAIFTTNANFVAANFKAKADFFRAVFLAEASFANAVFTSPIDFYDATFSSEADFRAVNFRSTAEFRQATFRGGALFRYANFNDLANFRSASFGGPADFLTVVFKGHLNMTSATFNGEANLQRATFNAGADFSAASFKAEANFREATFKDYVTFAGDESVPGNGWSLYLQFAKIENPDRVSFHTLTLHPHWFINVDARRFDFINIQWENYGEAKLELELLKQKGISSPHRLLVIACRKLAANAEENDRFRSASQFRRMAMDAERLENWRGFDFRKLNWWYWLASGYGERITRAALVLLGIWIVAGLLYTRVGFARWEPRLASEADAVLAQKDEVGAPLKFIRALTYSAGVMTLQKPEPKPATTAAQTVVLLETILGPVQGALLALAIRRKFMR
jgi:uncharacterized protein YjbI with pentapeptide repeats